MAINVVGSLDGTSSKWWWGAWLSATANPAPRACGLTLSRMAAGPHGEVLGKDLWQEGSLGRLPLWDQGGCSECCDLRGVSTQNWWWLGGPKSSKPWRRHTWVDISVTTVWRKKEGFLLAFSLVHTLKRQCGWKMIFLGFFISLWNRL